MDMIFGANLSVLDSKRAQFRLQKAAQITTTNGNKRNLDLGTEAVRARLKDVVNALGRRTHFLL
jgi:hypothetical protein